ncbi:hypothetical protein A8C32_13425 [Flavivirga aquatica]|uniref:NodB homology domain-containing protein n=1 Tax=Flavivirga aquatica TaxID=1849968 RepID=A0A1E5TE89_9FLAO|nr:polysaccharide deacetylase family protein [Flavivirga aquatica]OEK09696.1 hypothetical protein A8C32_13425 [Flavivirga aquatica]
MGLIKDILYKTSNKQMLGVVKNQSIFPYYHLVNNKDVTHIKHLYQFKNIEKFKQDLDTLLKYYKPLDPSLFTNTRTKIIIPKNHFLLTFDDGLSEIYNIIFPILKQKGINAVFFINPDFIDNNESLYKHDLSIIIESLKTSHYKKNTIDKIVKILGIETNTSLPQLTTTIKQIKQSQNNIIEDIADLLNIDLYQYIETHKPYLSKSQIQEMIHSGFYFGGHTMSHPRLLELSIEKQKKEVIDSIKWLKTNFNIDYSFFAFPFSDKGISKALINEIFKYDESAVIFGNSGIKKDVNNRIIQRFSLENPNKHTEKQIVTENLYKYYNKAIGKYKIKRN